MTARSQITLAQLRAAARRAFGSRARLVRTAKLMSGHGGESLFVSELHRNAYICGTQLMVHHSTSPQVARSRMLRILTALGNRRERRLHSGNVFCWSKP